jgi:hypothetical protein
MDITPTQEYLDDLQKRLERILRDDPDELEPRALQFGAADILVLLKALNEAIARWRPVLGMTLSELREATKQGADAWPPILARSKMTPRDFARALADAGNPAFKRGYKFEEIYDAVMEAFGLTPEQLDQGTPP